MTATVHIHPNAPGAPDPRELFALPSNIEAEQALLGAVLYENEAIHACEAVEPEDFAEPFHQRLWAAVAARLARGRLADPVALAEQFVEDPSFADLGGLRYLADLVNHAPPAANAPQYADLIRDAARRRDLVRLANDITRDAREARNAEDVIGEAESALLSMRTSNRKTEPVTAALAAGRVLDSLDAPIEAVVGVRTGLAALDEELGPLTGGDLVLLAGRPSMGKSAAAECIALNIAEGGAGVIQINGEMTPEQMAQRHLTDICHREWGQDGPEYRDIRRRRITPRQREMLGQAHEVLKPLPMVMLKRSGIRLAQLRSVARRQASAWARRDIRLGALIIDHMGLVKTDQPVRDRYEAQTIISAATKELAEELDCPIFALNQLNRESERRDDKRPQLSDLRDSGSWEQDADYVIGWYREAYYAARQPEPQITKTGKGADEQHMTWAEWDRARKSRVVEAIILKARAGATLTVKLWGDVARNAIRSAAPTGDLL